MARTVDTSSTFENWRQNYNDLATDVGGLGSLTTADKSSVVNAINYIMDQYFYFQDFEYDGSDGATSNTVFSGADNAGNTLAYSPGKVLVFKQGLLLRSGTDYTATNGTSITLASSANSGDVIRMSVFTGSYENVGAAGSDASVQWTLAGSTIYNHNLGGVILNADSTITTTLDVADSIQLQGNTYANGAVHIRATGGSVSDIRFYDADNSHTVSLDAPATISSSITLTLPASDGSSGQLLSTDGSGNLSFVSPATATDVNVVANNSANETVYPVFVDGATGSQGVESDTGLTYNPSTGMLTSTGFTGALTGNVTGTATVATTVTITDNENTAESNAVVFVSGANNAGGNLGLESDGDLTYNPGTGKLTSPSFDGNGLYLTALNATNITSGTIGGARIANDAIDSQHYADHSIDNGHISDNVVNADLLDVSGNGSSGQALISDGDGSFSWSTIAGTTYDLSVPSGTTTIRLDPSSGSNDDIALTAGTDISITRNSATQLTIASTASPLTTEAVQDIVGGMFSGNTETRITATYQDGDGTIDLDVTDMTANTNYYLDGISKSSNTLTFSVNGATNQTYTFGSNAFNSTAFTTNTGTVDTANSPVDNDFAKFTDADTIEGRSYAETKTDLSLNNVENTALSSWAGTTNITTLGTITSGTWQGGAISTTYLSGQSGTNTGDQTNISGNAATVTGTLENSGNTTAHYIPFATGTSTGNKALKFSTDTGAGDTGLKYVPGEGASNAFGTLYVDRTISKLFYVDADNQLTDTQLKTHRIGVNMSSAGVDGRIDASNDIVAFSSSDIALKENINPISNALDKVLALGGYTFDWKKEREEEHGYTGSDIGVLAQEVEDVLPTAVRDNCYGNKSVRYEKLIPLLVQSIKELKTELDELKSSNS